jgi:hypothetical protein
MPITESYGETGDTTIFRSDDLGVEKWQVTGKTCPVRLIANHRESPEFAGLCAVIGPVNRVTGPIARGCFAPPISM